MSAGLTGDNLRFLVICHGSQTALSKNLVPVLTQRKISSMIGGSATYVSMRLDISSRD